MIVTIIGLREPHLGALQAELRNSPILMSRDLAFAATVPQEGDDGVERFVIVTEDLVPADSAQTIFTRSVVGKYGMMILGDDAQPMRLDLLMELQTDTGAWVTYEQFGRFAGIVTGVEEYVYALINAESGPRANNIT